MEAQAADAPEQVEETPAAETEAVEDQPAVTEELEEDTDLPEEEQVDVVDDGEPLLSWEASEYIHHEKSTNWYLALVGIVAILVVVGVLTKQWFSIPVFVVMGAAIVVYGRKAPRTLNYSLTHSGIVIEDKFHTYDEFRSFGVIQDLSWHMIDLEPTKRLMPRMIILFDTEHLDDITYILEHLTREDRPPDWVEKLTRYLKF